MVAELLLLLWLVTEILSEEVLLRGAGEGGSMGLLQCMEMG